MALFYFRDYDGKVSQEEVADAAQYLKDTLGREGIQELISNLSKDKGEYCLNNFGYTICINIYQKNVVLSCIYVYINFSTIKVLPTRFIACLCFGYNFWCRCDVSVIVQTF